MTTADLVARLVIGAGRGLARLPPGIALWLGKQFGRAYGQFSPSRRLVAATNLGACFPELDPPSRQILLDDHFQALGMGVVETCQSYWRRELPTAIFHGRQHLDAPSPNGRLILMAHYTPVELICRLLSQELEAKPAIMVRHHSQPVLERAIAAARARHYASVIEKKDLRTLLRTLRQGGTVLYGPDQNFTQQSVFAPFFGIQTATLTTTAEIVARTGATAVGVWGYRDEANRYHVSVTEPWNNYPSGDALIDAARFNWWMETHIHKHPAQYLWTHRKFRHRPEGDEPFYPARARRSKHRH